MTLMDSYASFTQRARVCTDEKTLKTYQRIHNGCVVFFLPNARSLFLMKFKKYEYLVVLVPLVGSIAKVNTIWMFKMQKKNQNATLLNMMA